MQNISRLMNYQRRLESCNRVQRKRRARSPRVSNLHEHFRKRVCVISVQPSVCSTTRKILAREFSLLKALLARNIYGKRHMCVNFRSARLCADRLMTSCDRKREQEFYLALTITGRFTFLFFINICKCAKTLLRYILIKMSEFLAIFSRRRKGLFDQSRNLFHYSVRSRILLVLLTF